jgi:hypothetical protein
MEKALKETRIKSEDVKKRLSEDIKKMKQFASS